MENGYEVLAFTANNDAAAALSSGKADAWVVDNEVALVLAEQNGFTVLDEAMTTEPYAFAFPKGSDDLVAEFNKCLTKMLEDGSVAEIFAQYGINSGAYMAELMRSGIGAVDPGQMEAGRSLGMSRLQAARKIVLTRALTRAGNLIRNNTYDAVNPLLVVALTYLVLVVCMTALLRRFERRLMASDQH